MATKTQELDSILTLEQMCDQISEELNLADPKRPDYATNVDLTRLEAWSTAVAAAIARSTIMVNGNDPTRPDVDAPLLLLIEEQLSDDIQSRSLGEELRELVEELTTWAQKARKTFDSHNIRYSPLFTSAIKSGEDALRT